MLGLGLGAWMAGRWVGRCRAVPGGSWVQVYAVIELLIGICSLGVPWYFKFGEAFLLRGGQISSAAYLLGSAVAITAAILPACWLMGTTFPIMMAHARRHWKDPETSFSYLYRANVLGALAGSILTPVFLIEAFGFRTTHFIGVGVNVLNAFISSRISRVPRFSELRGSTGVEPAADRSATRADHTLLGPLFVTGFVSMAYEVIWTRSLTPILGTTIYAFATVLAVYLSATWMGASLYRKHLAQRKVWQLTMNYACLAFSAFLPVFLNDLRLHAGLPGVIVSLFPFCAFLGYATPQMVDHYSQGVSAAAGRAYAINIAGCVLGPLAACYAVLPHVGSKQGILWMASLLLTLPVLGQKKRTELWKLPAFLALGACLIAVGIRYGASPEEQCASDPAGAVIRRDYTATVISSGKGFDRQLFVNGIGLTNLTPITKAMAHLPMYCHSGRPESALVICFGMGTTYRSLLSWGLKTTAVELVPSVRDAFGYYFEDADRVMHNPLGRIVIDDGRRFLQRTTQVYDIITLDPPPPVEAAGSGLLYSTEFYDLAKSRLKQDGILQQWWPGGERKILFAVAQSLVKSFPHIRVYKGVGGRGYHFLASRNAIGRPTVDECLRRLTPGARQDLLEWGGGWPLASLVQPFIEYEIPIGALADRNDPETLTDDRPMNEYFLWRRWMDRRKGQYLLAR